VTTGPVVKGALPPGKYNGVVTRGVDAEVVICSVPKKLPVTAGKISWTNLAM
jgi:hypothetical protein